MNAAAKKPNVIIMYADDLGFGDLSCYGATDIETPNLDRLAASGIRFQQGYATAATCTPSRYSLLTGSYPWRNPKANILPGDAPLIIDTEAATFPKRMQAAGYKTGIVGKWHLGLGDGNLNWNTDINNTPNDVGFDYSYIMAATNDRVPCVYVENRQVVNLDPNDPIEVTYNWDEAYEGVATGRHNPELLKMKHSHGHDGTIVNGVGRIGHMRGGKAALWDDGTMADEFLAKACDFCETHKNDPFFLYYAFHQPHVPRLPAPRFEGATKLGPRGDVIVEMDWCVGQLLDKLEALGISDNTIVIFSSDNGPVLDDGYVDLAEELKGTHKAAGPLRGGKYSLFDGGTRVPFILSWPGTVKPGVSESLVCQHDFHASFAAMCGQELEENEAPDSVDVFAALTNAEHAGRDELVVEGIRAKTVYRLQEWAYIPPYEGPAMNTHTNTELGNSDEPQLYNLSLDIGQITNVAADEAERVRTMQQRLEAMHASERTR